MNPPILNYPIGCSRVKVSPLEDNLRALEMAVTDEDRAHLDALIRRGQVMSPFYKVSFSLLRYS